MNVSVKPSKLIRGATGDWEVVIGLEIHAQVTSNSKLFSGASTEFGGEPNSHVSLVDAAMPGMLPVINEECVRQAVRTGLGLNAQVVCVSAVQFEELFLSGFAAGLSDQPIKATDCWRTGRTRRRQTVLRLGSSGCIWTGCCKNVHDQNPTMSYVDLNRCSLPPMEIVSKPDIRDAE